MSISASAAAALMSAIGDNDENQGVSGWLDTGYGPLNEIMSGSDKGGIPYGRIVEIYGPPSSGKTALATKLMCEAQKAGGIAIFLDHERTFEVELAKSMGLNGDFPNFIYKRPKTWEESNNIAMKTAEVIRAKRLIEPEAPIIAVFDSVAAMIPQSVFEKGIDQYTMNDTTALARVASTTLKAINAFTADLNVCTVYLNQVRTKPGVVYGDPTTTPGGSAFEFYASVRLSLTRSKVVEQKDGEKEFTGQLMTIEAKKTKLTRPFQKTQLRLSFDDRGLAYFDTTHSLVEYAIEKGKLPYSKPRVTWIDGKQYFVKALVEKIKTEGLEADLKALFA